MSSSKAEIIEALDAAEAAYKAVAALPLHALSRFEQQALLNRLEELDRQLVMTERRLIGRLVSEAVPVRFGGASWAEVLSRRLRISQSEAQRRIAEATYGAVPAVDRSSTAQSEPRPRG